MMKHDDIPSNYQRIVLSVFVVAMLLVATTWFSAISRMNQDYRAEVASIERTQSNIVKGFTTHAEHALHFAESLLERLHSEGEKGRAPQLRAEDLFVIEEFREFIAQSAILDFRGQVIHSLVPVPEGTTLADREYFQTHIDKNDGTIFIGPPVVGRVSGKASFHISRRINAPDGSFAGVAVIALDANYFVELFKRMTLEERQNFSIIGMDGIIRVTDIRQEDLIGKSLKEGALFQHLQKAPSGSFRALVKYVDVERFVTYRKMNHFPLVVAVTLDEEFALLRFYERKRIYAVTAVSFSFVILLGATLLYRMIRRQEQTNLLVREEKERAEKYLNVVGTLMVALDTQGRVTMLNRAGVELLGYVEKELLGQYWIETVIPPEKRERAWFVFCSVMGGDLEHFGKKVDGDVITKTGQRIRIAWTNSVLFDLKGNALGTLSSGEDVTERREMESRLEKMATTDSLTGIANRRHFITQGKAAFETFRRYRRPLSLLMLDIDYFKKVNDTFGHSVGDEVLIRLAKVCEETMRSTDFCGRLGGEEFACLLAETGLQEAAGVAERLRQEIEGLVLSIDGNDIRFTVSIGVAEANAGDATLDFILKRADDALYKAKRAGRNRVVCDEENGGEKDDVS
jgi:diguanylate cyclase (GGDEF)-like protein/PAS domain S-box-containing protein